MVHLDIVPGLDKACHSLRHTADHKILSIQLERKFVQRSRHRLVIRKADLDPRDKILLAQCDQELLHIHRVHGIAIHFSDRKSIFFPIDRHAEKTACRYDMVFRRLFTKVFQRGERTLAELNLIKHDQRPAFCDRLPADMAQNRKKVSGAQIFSKRFSQNRAGLEIEIGHIIVMFSAELQYGIRLSNLSCALDHQGLAVFILMPLRKIVVDQAVHIQAPVLFGMGVL